MGAIKPGYPERMTGEGGVFGQKMAGCTNHGGRQEQKKTTLGIRGLNPGGRQEEQRHHLPFEWGGKKKEGRQ